MTRDYDLLSFLLRGKRRRNVLLALKEARMPKQVAEKLKLSISNVSNSIAELVDRGLVECVTPKEHIYKFYRITKKGIKALNQMETYEKTEKSK